MLRNYIVYLIVGLAYASPIVGFLMVLTVGLDFGGYKLFFPVWLVAVEFATTLIAVLIGIRYRSTFFVSSEFQNK